MCEIECVVPCAVVPSPKLHVTEAGCAWPEGALNRKFVGSVAAGIPGVYERTMCGAGGETTTVVEPVAIAAPEASSTVTVTAYVPAW